MTGPTYLKKWLSTITNFLLMMLRYPKNVENKRERKQILLTRDNDCCNNCGLPTGYYTLSRIRSQSSRVLNLYLAGKNNLSLVS
jgi:hypothetical protein